MTQDKNVYELLLERLGVAKNERFHLITDYGDPLFDGPFHFDDSLELRDNRCRSFTELFGSIMDGKLTITKDESLELYCGDVVDVIVSPSKKQIGDGKPRRGIVCLVDDDGTYGVMMMHDDTSLHNLGDPYCKIFQGKRCTYAERDDLILVASAKTLDKRGK